MPSPKPPKVKTPSQMKMEMAVDRARSVLPQAEREANRAKFIEGSEFPRGYHGTTSLDEHSSEPVAITRFNDMKPVWAAQNPSIAGEYVGHESGATYPLDISAKNPLRLNVDMNARVGSSPEIQKLLDSFGIDYNKQDPVYRHVNTYQFMESAQKLGHDSIIANERGEPTVGVFSSSQLKSSTGNTGAFNPNEEDIGRAKGGAVHMAGGGIKPKASSPTIMKRSGISELADYIKNREGQYGVQRLERAADEIPKLGEMYTQDALRSAFSGGENASALMTINPADFEKYAIPLPDDLPKSNTQNIVDLIGIRQKGGFNSVPYFEVNKEEYGLPLVPFISGHEGRHRSRALTEAGDKSSLVQFFPRAELREPFPRRSQEEYIEALKREMSITGNKVLPQTFREPSNTSLDDIIIRRPAIDLPDLYADGGAVKMRDGGDPQSVIDQAVLDQMRYELANQPKLKPTTDIQEQINNARRMADPERLSLNAGDAITSPEMYAQNRDLFNVNSKPASQAYTQFGVPQIDASGKSVPFPKTMYDIENAEIDKQLERGIKPKGMSDADFIRYQAEMKGYNTNPKTFADLGQNALAALTNSTFIGGGLRALGAIDQAAKDVIGSSYGLDPTIGMVGQTGRLHSVPRGLRTLKEGIARDVREFPNDVFNAQRGITTGYPTLGSEFSRAFVTPKPSTYELLSGLDPSRLPSSAAKVVEPSIPQMKAELREKVLAPANPQGFYSPTEAAALNLQRKSGSGQAFLNDIMKGENVRPDEINAMGLDAFLRGKKDVTAAEVQDYIAKNKIQLGETTYGNISKQKLKSERDTISQMIYGSTYDELPKYRQDAVDVNITPNKTKYGEYQLPGGENYREIVLTLPPKDAPNIKELNQTYSEYYLQAAEAMDDYKKINEKYPSNDPRTIAAYQKYRNISKLRDESKYILTEAKKKNDQTIYQSSHWEESNALAHLRVSDRVTDGKKTLLVDEVQSDWHQEGRDKGYIDNNAKTSADLEKELTAVNRKRSQLLQEAADLPDSEMERFKLMDAEIRRLDEEAASLDRQWTDSFNNPKKVPDAPYKEDWYQLALRRAVKEAIDNGYDRVALPTGQRVAERFDLSKQIDRIDYNKNDDGTYSMSAIKGGKQVFSKEGLDENELSGIVGKDVAKKIVGDEGSAQYDADIADELGVGVVKSLTGLDLKVGGKGMKKYYDEVYPNYLKKFGKKYGANVGKTSVDIDGNAEPLHYMEITPAMRKEFSTGIPMKRGGKVSFANNIDAMRLALSKG